MIAVMITMIAMTNMMITMITMMIAMSTTIIIHPIWPHGPPGGDARLQ